MKLLAVDGNSILNRAFYGIKLLSTKDGRFTNGIYGFMNILLGLIERLEPDSVCVAFDLKAPTFRHKMYSEYKAGRHPTPPELLEQFAPLKELLTAMGYTVLEHEGWEADDILGTLSAACGSDDFCYIATGDRDSLQLVSNNTNVLLASTKMGQTSTVVYDTQRIFDEYGVTPCQLIDIKAVMGDSSDNIPGVAGIGPKGAGELIKRFGSLDGIYENIQSKDIKDGTRAKLEASRDNAYMSYKLGTICREVPGIKAVTEYRIIPRSSDEVRRILTSLEMFKLLQRIDSSVSPEQPEPKVQAKRYELVCAEDTDALFDRLNERKKAFFAATDGFESVVFCIDSELCYVDSFSLAFYPFMQRLLSSEIEKYTTDTKCLYAFCIENGISAVKLCFDTSLAGYILNPNASDYSVDSLALSLKLPEPLIECEDEKLLSCARRAALLESVTVKLSAQLEQNGQLSLLRDIEIPLAGVLAGMEREGFLVDREGIESFSAMLTGKLDESLAKIYSLAGCEFNVNSPKQLGEVLFSPDKLNLPHGKKTKSGYSTDADVLEFLRDKHPVIPEIFEYRTLSKLKSTYCDGLLKVIDNDGRIHSTLNQTQTRTGRISSAEPNLQNIPVRRELGSQMRRFFVAKDGCVLVDADYSQIELRVLAYMANDPVMLKAFGDGDDIHAITASQVFGIPLDEVTPLMRSRAKAVNFGIVYGIGAFSLSNDIGVSVAEADRYIKSYLAHYSGVREFMERMKKQAKERGYAETLFGRRRYLPELSASNANMRAFGERVAMNMPIQGTAADIIKIAMVRTDNRLRREGLRSRLILQIHDELIVEAYTEEADKVEQLLREEMENAADMKGLLRVDASRGKSWYDAK